LRATSLPTITVTSLFEAALAVGELLAGGGSGKTGA
jgi:hypothetical protein